MEDGAAAASGRGRFVLVPRSPGPVIDLDGPERVPDEIDELIDELFGPDPGDRPGRTDVMLLVIGLALLLSGLFWVHSTSATVIGALLVFLGLVLPGRSMWRRAGSWRGERRRLSLSRRGHVLNAAHPATAALVRAYADLLVAMAPGTPLAGEAASAAHLALIESATLVGEEGPKTPEETAYVERRVSAIRGLVTELERHRGFDSAALDERAIDRSLDRRARVLAGEELDAGGASSLRELEDLKRVLACLGFE